VRLVSRLRARATTLQEEWEALGARLDAERRRLTEAEAILALLRQEEPSPDGGAGGDERSPQAGVEGSSASGQAMDEGQQAQASEGRASI
jgi:hypothetical protein